MASGRYVPDPTGVPSSVVRELERIARTMGASAASASVKPIDRPISGTVADATFLRLDCANSPLSGPLGIQNLASGGVSFVRASTAGVLEPFDLFGTQNTWTASQFIVGGRIDVRNDSTSAGIFSTSQGNGVDWANFALVNLQNSTARVGFDYYLNYGTSLVTSARILGGKDGSASTLDFVTRNSAGTLGSKLLIGGAAITISVGTMTWSGNPTHSGNHTFSANVAVNGNTVLGDANTDTLNLTARLISNVEPSTNNARNIGSTALRFANGHFVNGDFSGNVLLGDNVADTIGGTGSVARDWNPEANGTRSLGSDTLRWKELHASTVYEGGTSLASKYLLLSTLSSGEYLRGWEDNGNIDVSYDPTTRKVTLTHATGLWYQWWGVRYGLGTTWTSAAHDDDGAVDWFLYLSAPGVFEWSQAFWSFQDHKMVCYVSPVGFGLREVHGLEDWRSHQTDHWNIGTYRRDGGTLDPGSFVLQPTSPADADNRPTFTEAHIFDEDLPSTVASTASGQYTRIRIGAASAVQYELDQTDMVRSAVGGFVYYNVPATGAEVEASNARFLNVYDMVLPVTSDPGSQKYRRLLLQPQAQYTTLAAAQAEDFRGLSLGDLTEVSPEFVAVNRITIRTASSYGTTGKFRIEAVSVLVGSRASQAVISGFAITDHENLTGRSEADQHPISAITGLQSALDAKMANPMTAEGDLIYGGASGTPTRLAAGTDGYYLKLVAGVPVWAVGGGGGGGSVVTDDTLTGDGDETPLGLALDNANEWTAAQSFSGGIAIGGDITTNLLLDGSDNRSITINTVDGSDNRILYLGATSTGRGGGVRLYGNETASNAGDVRLVPGNAAGAKAILVNRSGQNVLIADDDGAQLTYGLRINSASKNVDYDITTADMVVTLYGTTGRTFTMPATPVNNEIHYIKNRSSAVLTLARNGNNIDGAAADISLAPGVGILIAWVRVGSSTYGWETW